MRGVVVLWRLEELLVPYGKLKLDMNSKNRKKIQTRQSKKNLIKISVMPHLQNYQTQKIQLKIGKQLQELFFFKVGNQYYGYLNLCRHWNIPLDYEDNDFFSDNKQFIVCKNHGALFDPQTGQCLSGPCEGKSLYQIQLINKNKSIYAQIPQKLI